ncbi:MAG: sugar nucleotide-binding protein [Deltaproteobacteria bacterium]
MILVLGSDPRAAMLARRLDGRHAADFDATSMRDVRRVVAEHEPTAVVWMRFWDDIAAAERDENRAYLENSEAVISLAAATMEFSATPVLVSTPELFGQRGGPWAESDDPTPRSVWAESRRRGEVLLMRAAPHAVVLRVGPLLSDDLSVERSALAAGVSTGPSRRVSPVSVGALATSIRAVLAAKAKGVVHVTADEAPVREHELWTSIAEALGVAPTAVRHRQDDHLAPNAGMRADRLGKMLEGPLPSWRAVLEGPAPAPVAAESEPTDNTWARTSRYTATRDVLARGDSSGGEGPADLFVERGKIALTVVKDGEESDRIVPAESAANIPAGATWSYVALADSVVFGVR